MELPTHLYKYRTVTDYAERLVVQGEVYFAPVQRLNDIAEGVFRQPDLDLGALITDHQAPLREMVRAKLTTIAVQDAKRLVARAGILSLAERPDSPLMWAYYAGEHTGICVELRTSLLPKDELKRVQYSQSVPSFYDRWFEWKGSDWAHEREWRWIREFQGVQGLGASAVSAVIMGARISGTDRAKVEGWAKASGVALKQARLAEASFGLVIDDVPP